MRKTWKEMSQLWKWKKVQGAVGLYSQDTNPACDVMEGSVRMEHFRWNPRHEEGLEGLTKILSSPWNPSWSHFFFDTPDLGNCSTLFLPEVEHVQMHVLSCKHVSQSLSHWVANTLKKKIIPYYLCVVSASYITLFEWLFSYCFPNLINCALRRVDPTKEFSLLTLHSFESKFPLCLVTWLHHMQIGRIELGSF